MLSQLSKLYFLSIKVFKVQNEQLSRQYERLKNTLEDEEISFKEAFGFFANKADFLDIACVYGLSPLLGKTFLNGCENPRLYFKSGDADKFAEDCTREFRSMILCMLIVYGETDTSNSSSFHECKLEESVLPVHIIQYQY